MSMTYEQFVEYATSLKNHSDSIDDHWNLLQHRCPMNGSFINYLTKKEIRKINKSSLKSDQSSTFSLRYLDATSSVNTGLEHGWHLDTVLFHCLTLQGKHSLTEDNIPIVCEYQILYNPSYSCPDVFFNMWYTDGKLLSLEHVWSLVHSFLKQNVVRDKWNAITQEIHPFSSRPFFRLHPCKNTHVLEMLCFSSRNNYEFNPLIAWLSTISPLIGLEIHLSYGNKFKS